MGKLDDYTVEEIDKLIRKHKKIKEAANELGVTAQEVYAYRSKYAKEFSRLKAKYEQGLIVEDELVIKTRKTPKTASQIEVKIPDSDKSKALQEKLDALEIENKQLQETIDNLSDQITEWTTYSSQLEEMNRKLKDDYKELERKSVNAVELAKRTHEQKRSKLLETIHGHKASISQMTNEIARLRGELSMCKSVNDKNEKQMRDDAIEYESTIKDLQDKLNGISQDEKEVAMTSISPPSHYAPANNGVDVIGFTQMQMSLEEVRGATKMNIMKYATRLGRKDEEIKELSKIIDYATRYKEYLERLEDAK